MDPQEVLRQFIAESLGDTTFWEDLQSNVGAYVHYTNVLKLGIDPRGGVDNFNPKGLYGIPITLKYLNTLRSNAERFLSGRSYGYERRKYACIFKVREGLSLLKLHGSSARDEEFQGLEGMKGPTLTKALIEDGWDGVVSTNYGLSGDIESEICIFPPYSTKIEVVTFRENTISFDVAHELSVANALSAAKTDVKNWKSHAKRMQVAKSKFMQKMLGSK